MRAQKRLHVSWTINKYFRLFVGVVLVVSAAAKATGTAAFANLLGQYGFMWLGYLAPIIILVELLVGLLLVFDIKSRRVAAATIALICLFSAVFAYGLIHLGIRDCGCFGPLTFLNQAPWFTFTRNGVLVALLIPSLFYPDDPKQSSKDTVVFMAVVVSIVLFICGFSFRGADCLQRDEITTEQTAISPALREIVDVHADSTYLVYAFSYDCPFCLNSIGNVNQFVTMHAVDRVVGIAVEDDEAAERFNRLFKVDFPIKEISALKMLTLSHHLPVAWLIQGDSVRTTFRGQVPTPVLIFGPNLQP